MSPLCRSAVLAAGLIVAACRSPFMQKPLTATERSLDCPQLDLAIDRADTVRWMIRAHKGTLESSSERTTRRAIGVVLTPLAIINPAGWMILIGPNPSHDALNASDQRIRELLQTKRAHGCPARVTTLPKLNDMDVLAEIESLQAKLDAESGDETALFKERTRLLDGLRVVPSQAAAARGQPANPPAE